MDKFISESEQIQTLAKELSKKQQVNMFDGCYDEPRNTKEAIKPFRKMYTKGYSGEPSDMKEL